MQNGVHGLEGMHRPRCAVYIVIVSFTLQLTVPPGAAFLVLM